MRNNAGCLNALGLGLGLSIGGGLIYYLIISYEFRLVLGVITVLTLGIVLGSVGLLLNNRQWTRGFHIQQGPGGTTYRIDARPQPPSYYPPNSPVWNSWPSHPQLGPPLLPDMPPMPPMPPMHEDDPNDSLPVA